MRDSNYKIVGSNRAAVTITTSLYDRRALDVTSDKPLVNSLNHLTYLVSSSAKVRETLSIDGGIERLIEILHECHNSTFNTNDTIFNTEKKMLTAWKWTLSFQCIVLIGTRGTETIRKRVVKAGILPIIATILDNYISLHDNILSPPSQNPRRFAESFGSPSNQPQSRNLQSSSQLATAQDQPEETNNSTSDPASISTARDNANANTNTTVNITATATVDANATATVNATESISNAITNNTQNYTDTNNNENDRGLSENLNFLTQFEAFQNSFPPTATAAAAAMSFANHPHPHHLQLSSFKSPNINGLNIDDYENFSVDQLLKLVRLDEEIKNYPRLNVNNNNSTTFIDNSIRKRYIILVIMKKLKEEKDGELLDTRFTKQNDFEMDNNLQFLSDLYLQDDKMSYLSNLTNSKLAPRNFTDTGVVIPRDDDIVWSLQLLAYISKYPYLKESLQNSHLVIDMSVRDKQIKLGAENELRLKLQKNLQLKQRPTIKPKSRKSKVVNHQSNTTSNNNVEDNENVSKLGFSASASNSPQMLNGINTLQEDNFVLDQDKLELCDETERPPVDDTLRVETTAVDEINEIDNGESDPESGSVSDYSGSDIDNFNAFPSYFPNKLASLYESIYDCEKIEDKLERELALYDLNEQINNQIKNESKKLRLSIIKKRLEQKRYLKEKWDYNNYKNFDIDLQPKSPKFFEDGNDPDYDDSLVEYQKVNLFPMVEKYTCLSGTDMYYWSGVIMRNSCRRNDTKGGVRQCGNLECGKWESYPREFSKCRRCKRTKYCSRECQMTAWQCHRNWCIPSTNSSNSNRSNNVENQESNITGTINGDTLTNTDVTPRSLYENNDNNTEGNE